MDIKNVLQSQYLAALEMLKKAIEMCPPSMWADPEPRNKFWHITFHTLFYAHFYLHPTEKDFVPWIDHRGEIVSLSDSSASVKPYSQTDMMEYLSFCQGQVREKVAAAELEAESGFYWLPFTALEKHIYNIRHIQLHTGELCERLGQAGIDVGWIGLIHDG